jgi:hypothetical protein
MRDNSTAQAQNETKVRVHYIHRVHVHIHVAGWIHVHLHIIYTVRWEMLARFNLSFGEFGIDRQINVDLNATPIHVCV